MDELNKDQYNDLDSLEGPATLVRPTQGSAANTGAKPGSARANAATADTLQAGTTPVQPFRNGGTVRRLLGNFNIYMLLFVLLLVLSGIGGTLFYLKAHTESTAGNTPQSQSLSQSTLDNLANSDVTVGEPKHTLSVQSNAVFSGSVLMRSNLQVAGTLQVGNSLAINGIRVTGSSTFDDVQITKSLAVTGNGSLQGQLNVQKSLNVNGGGTFLGAVSAPSLTIGSLQLNGDLNLTHHLTAGGSTPSRSNGSALGSGGTVSVSGSDTAGSVTINTGSGPTAGCFITITFTRKFNSIPHMVVTPVGSGAAGLQYYINRSTSQFSICTTNAAVGSTTFGFDYIAFD